MGKDILKNLAASPVEKVKVAVTDIDGVLRGKYLHKSKFLSAAETGFGFCNVVFGWDSSDVCYDNVRFTGWHSGYPDVTARIDLSTYRRVPWDNNVPFFLADFDNPEDPKFSACPRGVLKRVVAKAHAMGLRPFFGAEFEWFNFKETPESLREKSFVAP